MQYFYDLQETGTFGVPNRILRDAKTDLKQPLKAGLSVENCNKLDSER